MSVDTTNWNKYPFTVDGVNFVSLIKPESELANRIAQVPVEIFQSMNIGAVRDCIGAVKFMTRQEILEALEFVNAGFEQAYVGLAE